MKQHKVIEEKYPSWFELDKDGFVLEGFTKLDNSILHLIINETNSATALGIYIFLLSHRNNKTNKCFPSMRLLERETGITKKTIVTLIKLLQEKGFIQIEHGKNGGTSSYTFPLEDFYKQTKNSKQEEEPTKTTKSTKSTLATNKKSLLNNNNSNKKTQPKSSTPAKPELKVIGGNNRHGLQPSKSITVGQEIEEDDDFIF